VILFEFRSPHRVCRVPSFFLAKRMGALPGDCDDRDEPLAKHVIEEFMKETELCAREQVDCGYEEASGQFSR